MNREVAKTRRNAARKNLVFVRLRVFMVRECGAVMSDKSWHLSRRTFLRGSGAAIALPWLNAMKPVVAMAGSAAAGPPGRMGCLFFPDRAWLDNWIPKTDGADY